ncbi:MAG: aminotransferase class V-fold PLP-dependent enzyme, partial [Ruminococcus sp.]|nr:aminotransferase class V-fold PLP-dependent enzyme [Ruminococcus sp.]
CFIADGAQACGLLDLTLDDGFNFLCTAGHKSLYGPAGTGLLITDGSYHLSTIVEGGTGATSNELEQTPFMPEKLESGTINTVGIIGLGEALKFVSYKTPGRIMHHEEMLCRQFINGLKAIPNIKVYRSSCDHVPIVAFNYSDVNSQEFANHLSEKGFALRGGLQCAALTHYTLGTLNQGVVRFSPSAFNTPQQVSWLLNVIKRYK